MIVDAFLPRADPRVIGSKAKTGNTMARVLGAWSPETTEPVGYCPVGTCTVKVPERVLVCHGCVHLVPDHLLDAYRATYVKGQNALTQSAENKAAYAAIVAHCAGLS